MIQTKSELPNIIPPLPKGDTKDMKIWREYWKQHDTAIRKAEREKVLDIVKQLHDIGFKNPVVTVECAIEYLNARKKCCRHR